MRGERIDILAQRSSSEVGSENDRYSTLAELGVLSPGIRRRWYGLCMSGMVGLGSEGCGECWVIVK